MKTASEMPANPMEQTMDYWRKSMQWGLGLQEEILDHWTQLWSGVAQPPDDVSKRFHRFQKDWSNTLTDIMSKHRAVLDQQYRSCIDTLEESLRTASAKDPEEFRERCGSLCRKMLDAMKENSESQLREFQAASNKWIELWRTSP
jgi:hypothetical protein